ncbi:GNAT family N-acetyltransferase [Phormidium tenue FACHB-886]|nr:GNAT family N-acetyltransferase [Phormidium tenue FACHB-886]
MIIRSAQPPDVANLLPMIAKICALHENWDAAKYGFLPHPERRYESWLNRLIQNQRDLCLVAEDNNQLIGFLIATVEQEIPIYRLKQYAFIHDLWIEDEYRRGGIAKQMVQQAIANFQQLGITQIRLDTAHPNEAARRLFTDCGFRISTIEMLIELN